MKATYARILARKILIAFLAFIIILTITALFVRHSISEKLEYISTIPANIENGQSKPEHALLLLHQADDDFQESLVDINGKKSIEYKTKLSQAFNEIDTLLKAQTDTAKLTPNQRVKVKYWYQKKLNLSDKLYVLKHNFDSLLTVYADFNTQAAKNEYALNTNQPVKAIRDTVSKSDNKKPRSLIKRIKDAIVNKDDHQSLTPTKHGHGSKQTSSANQKAIDPNQIAYGKKLKQLQQSNVKLLNMQKALITLNTRIVNELEKITTDIEESNYNMASEFKTMALKSYQDSTSLLNGLYLTALVLVLIFAALLIVFIFELNKSELQLHSEIDRSVAIAQQKTGLLLHMSHEVRNPLTAINGLLYIFSKSNLMPRQTDMLASIKASSEMILRTLNDTLDAAKMENSELKINAAPFNPDFALRTVMTSLEFSAAKKGLTMEYNFNGDKDAMVVGDGFRLEQLMVNLLSNAIKYTDKGGITINARLTDADSRLEVDVKDTGAGISQEQQAKLFSKYYQTNSSKGQVGTGLGLFICKQLIALQGGEITVKSTPGEGSIFSFSIPYQKQKGSAIDQNVIHDPLVALNGVSVLAVDDNEFNLLLLKKILEKWNVHFLQASNGKQALEIIPKNAISIILTDIEMPEMDGNKLLAAINTSDKPVPVIAISGNAGPANADSYLKKGFSGVISKPYTEAGLIDELVKVIKQ